MNADHAQAIEQVLAELALGDALFQIDVGRGDDPDVDPRGTGLADRQDFALFQEPQETRLYVDRQIADFVEEDGLPAAVRITPG